MTWENLGEKINENESDSENYNSPINEENPQNISTEEEEANDEFTESSSSTGYDHLEQERTLRKILLPGKMKTKTHCIRLRNRKEVP